MLQEEIYNFSKMWTWLYQHPGHDQQYYMKNVERHCGKWNNNCPLSNNDNIDKCDGCSMLWKTNKGNLCTDAESPLNTWIRETGAGDADKRTYYAGRLIILAGKNLR